VGRAVAKLATEFGFRITIFDQRKEIFDSINLPEAMFIIKDYFEAILETDFDRNTYIVVTTPQHTYDEQITGIVATKPHAYVGMIGSKKKVTYLKTRFLENQVLTQEQIEDIDMPIGIPFTAETPEEIAVSIIAKLIDVKNTIKNEPS
jgi:xanthine dehydrogenase accessory factor